MQKPLYILAIVVLLASMTNPAFARAIQAQVPTPEVGGPAPDVRGRTTITPGGVREPSAPVAEPAEPEITTETEQPEVVAPPTVVEPSVPPDTRTVPRIDMDEPVTQSTPAGVGAGPDTADVVPPDDFPEDDTFATGGQDDLIPRAGMGLGWLALLGGAMTGAGLARRIAIGKGIGNRGEG